LVVPGSVAGAVPVGVVAVAVVDFRRTGHGLRPLGDPQAVLAADGVLAVAGTPASGVLTAAGRPDVVPTI
jgi:hypothetical protein